MIYKLPKVKAGSESTREKSEEKRIIPNSHVVMCDFCHKPSTYLRFTVGKVLDTKPRNRRRKTDKAR